MAYSRTFWQDHVTDQNGNVIQKGTLVDEAHMNNIEEGVFNSDQITGELLRVLLLQSDEVDSLKGETLNLTLKNTQTYPFNNSKTTVQLSKYRANKDYTIYIEVQSVTGGAVGDFVISDKMLNGFKLEYTGSASSVDVSIHVRGGI